MGRYLKYKESSDNTTTVKHLKFAVRKRRRQIASKSRMFNFKKAKGAK